MRCRDSFARGESRDEYSCRYEYVAVHDATCGAVDPYRVNGGPSGVEAVDDLGRDHAGRVSDPEHAASIRHGSAHKVRHDGPGNARRRRQAHRTCHCECLVHPLRIDDPCDEVDGAVRSRFGPAARLLASVRRQARSSIVPPAAYWRARDPRHADSDRRSTPGFPRFPVSGPGPTPVRTGPQTR